MSVTKEKLLSLLIRYQQGKLKTDARLLQLKRESIPEDQLVNFAAS